MQKRPFLHAVRLTLLFVPLLLSGCLFGSGGGEGLALKSTNSGQSIPYSVDFKLAETNRKRNGEATSDREKTGEGISGDQNGLLSELRANSQLVWLHGDPPDSRVGLERRLLEDMETAGKILRSNGYYDGTVSRRIDWDASPVAITIRLRPGQQYVIGSTRLRYSGASPFSAPPPSEEEIAVQGKNFMLDAPEDLSSFGLTGGTPARAETVLAAVDRVPATMHNQGYPLARTGETHYVIDRSTCTLDAEIVIETGPLLRMGDVRTKETGQEAPSVNDTYLNRLATWTQGQYWSDALLTSYRTALQETGLFSSITLKPDLSASDGRASPERIAVVEAKLEHSSGEQARTVSSEKTPTSKGLNASTSSVPEILPESTHGSTVPVSLTVRDAPPRTVSGGMQYSTDTGFGVRGSWENRNLFGGGEQLRLSAPIAQDAQRLSATFRKPAFGRRDQALVGEAELLNEETDAYHQTAAYVAGGLERRFSGDWRNWWASARLSLEGGSLDDNIHGKQDYLLFGVPLGLKRDTTNDLFNPTRGTRFSLSLTPYTGTYNGPLTTIRTRVDVSGYWTPFSGDRLVLAARAAAGSLTGEKVADIPASLRFYAGGGGSVRGYKYQSLGPKDRDGDPIGGLSFNDVSLEARFRITESFGIVPFVDGGMVYDSSMPDWGRDMAWGVGLGFRYYTLIGPIRLDIATPLQDRDDNKAFQIYLSIGQAF